MVAMNSNSGGSDDTTWYSNTRATHHITSELNNLSVSTYYNGNDQVQVGNG